METGRVVVVTGVTGSLVFSLDAPIAMPKQALQQDAQEKLWSLSAQRTGLRG